MSKSLDVLYNCWKKLKEEAKEDCKAIPRSALLTNGFDLADKHITWLNHMNDWKAKYIKLEMLRKNLYRELYEFYRDEYSHRLDRKEDMSLFIETDQRYFELNEKTQVIKGIITYCEGVTDKLKQKQWEIKGFTDYIKFMEGRVN